MRADLLLHLCDEAEKNLKVEEFNLADWFMENKETCQTTCCIVGFGATLPKFKELGLRLVPEADYDGGTQYTIKYMGFHSFLAVANFFDIPECDAVFLFTPGMYSDSVTKEDVIARIREYVQVREYVKHYGEEHVPSESDS